MRKTVLTLTLSAVAAAMVATTTPAFAAHGGLTVTGLTANDRLVTFLANSPQSIRSSVKVTGVEGDLASIDFRPATGGLYGVSVADDGGRLYLIDPKTGSATRVGTAVYPIAGNVSIDVNPAVDRLRVVSDDTTNLRVNPDDGALAATDGELSYVAGDRNAGQTPGIGAVAYTNNLTAPPVALGGTAAGTQLFDIDSALDTLALQDPPNAGGLVTRGPLGQGTRAGATGFDVYQREAAKGGQTWAFVSLWDKGVATFYEINLTDGSPRTFPANPADPASGTAIGGKPFVTDIALAPSQGV